MKYYILFGPPGAGKGTQAGSIAKKYNLTHVSTGALLRAEIAAGTELGKQAKTLIDAGNFVPDAVVEGMLEGLFASAKDTAGFLLDGFPRNLSQAEDLDVILQKKGEKVDGVISIMIPDAVIAERITHRAAIEGRADDADPEVIQNRIQTYHKKTEPLIQFYDNQGKYHQADGVGTIDEVHNRLSELMDHLS
ncbi:MAG: adenylate kinase [Bacteroidales bacterium]|nr:adenylate kinase [Bacteroidales bacterium]